MTPGMTCVLKFYRGERVVTGLKTGSWRTLVTSMYRSRLRPEGVIRQCEIFIAGMRRLAPDDSYQPNPDVRCSTFIRRQNDSENTTDTEWLFPKSLGSLFI